MYYSFFVGQKRKKSKYFKGPPRDYFFKLFFLLLHVFLAC